jgi:hypothetical protein
MHDTAELIRAIAMLLWPLCALAFLVIIAIRAAKAESVVERIRMIEVMIHDLQTAQSTMPDWVRNPIYPNAPPVPPAEPKPPELPPLE